jgi:outer membrane protein TolC
MRWKAMVLILSLLGAVTAGCQQQCFLKECDYEHYRLLGLPQNLPCDPTEAIVPSTRSDSPLPATVLNPDIPIHYLTLNEAFAVALEQGTVGSPSPLSPGISNDNLVTFLGRGVGNSDSIRVLALDPAIIATDIEGSLAKFDVHWTSSMTWQGIDQPLSSGFSFFSGGVPITTGGFPAQQTENANFSTSVLKPLPTGGVAGITFSTAYTYTNLPANVNPAYRPVLQFQFEQPLLQGYGVEINQIRATHPGSVLTPFNVGGRVEGIVITRLRFDQQRAEFERNVHVLLLNVEVAYWNLYGAYWNLYASEQAVRQAYETWRIQNSQFLAGRLSLADLAQTRGQYELFRSQRLTAVGIVLEDERRLRALMGIRRVDGTRLVPVDKPDLAPYQPDWTTSLADALALRPEMVLARNDLKLRQFDLINAKNQLLPDLRFTSTYDINALGSRLDGPGNPNAMRNLFRDQFNDWSLGLRLDVPLGFRDAHAIVRLARLNLTRSYLTLKDQEDKAERFLELEFRQLAEFHAQIQAVRSQRQAFAQQLEIRFQEFLAGRGTLDILLEAQRNWSSALANEYGFIVQYNNALAGFQFAKGTIMQYDNVVIAEGPLAGCAEVRAVEHERQRAKALLIRERANPVAHPPCDFQNAHLGLPQLPADGAPSLPALLKEYPPLPENLPQQLPNPPPPARSGLDFVPLNAMDDRGQSKG